MKYYTAPEHGYVTEVHIADIHFGRNAAEHFRILEEQFLNKITTIRFDILSIDGDIFDRKEFANSEAVQYAIAFVDRCVYECKRCEATLVLIHGTRSHDANQLNLFYHYLSDPYLDLRIVEQTKFELIKGLKVLCIPEEYGKGEEYYDTFLSQDYDTVFFHGTVVGSVYGANKSDLDSTKYPVFSINDFHSCRGPIIGGHVHKAMCLNGYIYYVSNPIRSRFGEEEAKGFLIAIHNLVSHAHTVNFIEISSYAYRTIRLDDITNNQDPSVVIAYLNQCHLNGVDNIRLDFDGFENETVSKIIEGWANGGQAEYVKLHNISSGSQAAFEEQAEQATEEKYKGLEFLLDKTLDDMTKFVMYVNYNKGCEFITVDRLKELLEG